MPVSATNRMISNSVKTDALAWIIDSKDMSSISVNACYNQRNSKLQLLHSAVQCHSHFWRYHTYSPLAIE